MWPEFYMVIGQVYIEENKTDQSSQTSGGYAVYNQSV